MRKLLRAAAVLVLVLVAAPHALAQAGAPARRIASADSLPATCFSSTAVKDLIWQNTVGPFTCTAPNVWTAASGTGTVTSVGLSVPTWLSVSGSPVTTSGTLAVAAATGQTANQVVGTCNGATVVSLCSITAGMVPTLNQDTTGKSAKTDALNSATTVVNVSSATAPSSGQVLTATSGTTATWQTPTTTAPAGSGSELQFRSNATTFGAIPSSSVSGANLTLGGTFGGPTNFQIFSNSIEALRLATTVSGQNYVLITPGASNTGPTIAAAGAGTNLSLKLGTTGSGNIDVSTIMSNGKLLFDANNYIQPVSTSRLLIRANGGVDVDLNSTGISYAKVGLGGMAVMDGSSLAIPKASVFGWPTSGSPSIDGSLATVISPVVDGVVGFGVSKTPGNRAGFYEFGGTCVVASDQTNATTTPQTAACYNVTSGTVAINLAAGRSYSGVCEMFTNDSVSTDGAVMDMDASTATCTTCRFQYTAFDTALNISQQTTALATDAAATTFTGNGAFEIHFFFKVNAAGTFQPRFFQNTHTTGTLTLAAGSNCVVIDVTP